MELNKKTLEKLRKIINGDDTAHARSGPKLVEFFNDLGFNDTYGIGFPSRWVYTDSKLNQINGTSIMEKCIRELFNPINHIDSIKELDDAIVDFNKYLAFDKWKISRVNENIVFKQMQKVVIDNNSKNTIEEENNYFDMNIENLNKSIDNLELSDNLSNIIKTRLDEVRKSLTYNLPVAAVILTGSILEGILYEMASSKPREFNQARSAPKNKCGENRKFHEWTLNNFIDVASEIGMFKLDIKDFSKVIRNYRNYIHPRQQALDNFTPDIHTASICIKVLATAIYQIEHYIKVLGE